ncbi:MAG: hypothetical protein QXZ36_07600 [Thermoproteota archaeon]
MAAYDIFFAVVILSTILEIIFLPLTYVVYSSMSLVQNAIANIPTFAPVSSITTMSKSFILFIPTAAALMVYLLILESWILSFFIKGHPLGAVYAIVMLFVFTIASFFVANEVVVLTRAIQAASPTFATILSNSSFMLFTIINMPYILVFATVVDIGIAVVALRS